MMLRQYKMVLILGISILGYNFKLMLEENFCQFNLSHSFEYLSHLQRHHNYLPVRYGSLIFKFFEQNALLRLNLRVVL